jgi:hypothetical protein
MLQAKNILKTFKSVTDKSILHHLRYISSIFIISILYNDAGIANN